MARVPTTTGNLVERRATPATNVQAVDFGAGGRAVGEAAQRLGATITQFGETQDQIDAQLDEAGAKQLDVQYSDWSRKRLYSEDGAFYTREGFEAANARPAVEKEIADQREALLGRATTPRMRYMLNEALQRRTSADMEGVARHATTQLRTEQKRQSAARMAAAGDDAVTYADDPVRFGQELAVGLTEVREEASRSGFAPEVLKRAEQEFSSGVYQRVAQGRIGRGDIEGASAWLEANRARMLPEDVRGLDAALRAPLLERQADGIVDGLLGVAAAVDAQTTAARGASALVGGGTNMVARMASITSISESGGRETDSRGRRVTSPKGAQGIMQVMPGTQRDPGFGVKPSNGTPEDDARVGRDYLAKMMQRYGGDPAKAWAAYNWGPGNLDAAISKHGGDWLAHAPGETRAYVQGNMAALGGRPGVQQAPREHDMATLLQRVDQLNLPFEVEQQVRRQLTERVGLDESLLRQRRDRAQESALEIIDRAEASGKPITRQSQIPQSVWDSMAPNDRLQLRGVIERNAQPKERATDYGTYTNLSDLYARDPAAFAQLNPMSFRNSLSNSDYEQVMGWRRDALSNAAKGGRGEGQVTFSRIRGVVQNAVQGAGLTYAGLRTKDRDGRAAVDRRVYQLEKAISTDVELWQRANPGKAISDQEISQIADRQLIRWRPTGVSRDVADDNPQFWFERDRTPGRPGVASVPTAELNRLKATGRRILGREPTEGELLQAYLTEARGGR